MTIIEEDIRFLKEHPEAARWLENHIETQLWTKFQPSLESSEDDSNH